MLSITPTELLQQLGVPPQSHNPVERERMAKWLDENIARGRAHPPGHSVVVTLTPVLATLLLERDSGNRPIGNVNLTSLKTDIVEGRFEFNGESIVISDTGILLDGQHRLVATVLTGIPIPVTLVFGPKEPARFTIDIGKPKTAQNFLSMKGHRNAAAMAAAVGNYLQWADQGPNGGQLDHSQKPTKTRIVEAAKDLKGMEESVSFVERARKQGLGSSGTLGFCHYVFKKKAGKAAADEFFEKLIDGAGLGKKDPIYVCREKIRKMEPGTRPNSRAEAVFKAWNAHRRGVSISSISLHGGKLPKVER